MFLGEYVKLLNGEYSFINDNHVIIMQEFIDGYTTEKNKGSYKETLESEKKDI